MWPFEFTATADASPAVIPFGNLKNCCTGRYGSSGTAWNGAAFTGADCAPASKGKNAIHANTMISDFFIVLHQEMARNTLPQVAFPGGPLAAGSMIWCGEVLYLKHLRKRRLANEKKIPPGCNSRSASDVNAVAR